MAPVWMFWWMAFIKLAGHSEWSFTWPQAGYMGGTRRALRRRVRMDVNIIKAGNNGVNTIGSSTLGRREGKESRSVYKVSTINSCNETEQHYTTRKA